MDDDTEVYSLTLEDKPTLLNLHTLPESYYAVISLKGGKRYRFSISEYQSCCEDFGFVSIQDDDLAYFIGAAVYSFEIVVNKPDHFDEGGNAFLKIRTELGVITLTAYNDHNGWYSHEVAFGEYEDDSVKELFSTSL